MFKIPTNEQWQQLFDVSKRLKKRKPWLRFPEELIFCCSRNDSEESFYITVHGFEEEALGISMYAGREDISKYLRIIDEGDDVSFQTIIANQSCLTVIYGEKYGLGAGDISAMEAAGYLPDEGKNGYIYFRRYDPGFSPWYIGSEDVEKLILGFTAFEEILSAMPEETVDPQRDMVLLQDHKVTVTDFDDTLRREAAPIVKDDIYIAQLKRLKKTGRSIELSISYMATPVGSNLGPIPFFPKICIIADFDGGFIADQCIFEETSDEEESFYAFIAKYFHENGLPRQIKVKNQTITYLIEDLCKKLRITIKEEPQLVITDEFLEMIGGLTPEE